MDPMRKCDFIVVTLHDHYLENMNSLILLLLAYFKNIGLLNSRREAKHMVDMSPHITFKKKSRFSPVYTNYTHSSGT